MKTYLAILAVLAAAPYGFGEVDLNRMAPGTVLDRQAADERAKLFPDAKAEPGGPFRPFRKDSPLELQVAITPAHELVFSLPAGREAGACNLALDFPKTGGAQISFSVKVEHFFAKVKDFNRLAVNLGGLNLMLRGDTRDLRYFDTNEKKFVRLTSLKEGEYFEVKATVSCAPEPVFQLNDRPQMAQRSATRELKLLQFSGSLRETGGKAPTVTIRNLVITSEHTQ